MIETLNNQIILTWLSLIWFSIDGPAYGIVVRTYEEGSDQQFVFNDLAWNDISCYGYYRYDDTSTPVGRYFNVSLTTLDVYQRTKVIVRRANPYQNKWRFFKKDGLVQELVYYGNESGTKRSDQDIDELDIIEHPSLLDRLKHELSKPIKLIEEGVSEFLPGKVCVSPIYEGAIETCFSSEEFRYQVVGYAVWNL